MLANLGRRIGSLLFGGSCFLCRGRAEDLLCRECDADLPRLDGDLCPRCALASPAGAVCGRCLAQPPHYDATVAALAYRFPADVLVHALKFRAELALAPLFAGLLSQKLAARRARGFHPARAAVGRPAARARLQPGARNRPRHRPFDRFPARARTLRTPARHAGAEPDCRWRSARRTCAAPSTARGSSAARTSRCWTTS